MNETGKTPAIISGAGKTAEYLWQIGNRLSITCPAASRYYIFNLENKFAVKPELMIKGKRRSFLYCSHCGSLWAPGNHKVRIQAPHPANQHIKKLLKWEREQPWKLNSQQKRKLRKFRESTSQIVYSCFHCKKNIKYPGLPKLSRGRINVTPSSSTPLSKIKCKKGDLNAGLFIPTPNKETLNQLEGNDSKASCETPSSFTLNSSSFDTNYSDFKKESLLNKPLTVPFKLRKKTSSNQSPKTPSMNASQTFRESVSFSNKKKTLLAQILQQEQASKKKKKNNLASFLISL